MPAPAGAAGLLLFLSTSPPTQLTPAPPSLAPSRLLTESYEATVVLAADMGRAACGCVDLAPLADNLFTTFLADYPSEELAWMEAKYAEEVRHRGWGPLGAAGACCGPLGAAGGLLRGCCAGAGRLGGWEAGVGDGTGAGAASLCQAVRA